MDEDTYQRLLNSGFRFISYRPRSEKETRDFLEKKLKTWKTYAPGMVGKIMDRLRELGYIDDRKFTEWWINARAHHSPKGKRLVTQELKAKGISKDLLEDSADFPDEAEMARKALTKKLKSFTKLQPLERKKKIFDYLGRRGFSWDIIESIIDEHT